MKLKKLKILMNLWILTLLGKHTKKADVIKKANLFKSYGGGGTGIRAGYQLSLN